jgi:hypothetical protein
VECWQSACETDSGATGTCVPYGLDGAPCKSSTTCAEFYECANGACQSEVSLIGDSAAYADALAEINACM